MSTLAITLAVFGTILLAAFVLFGAWIYGRRQAMLERGQHPTTTDTGDVVPEKTEAHVHPAKD